MGGPCEIPHIFAQEGSLNHSIFGKQQLELVGIKNAGQWITHWPVGVRWTYAGNRTYPGTHWPKLFDIRGVVKTKRNTKKGFNSFIPIIFEWVLEFTIYCKKDDV